MSWHLTLIFCFCFLFLSSAHAGECLDSRDNMLADYRKAVQQAIAHPEGDHGLGPWIEHCWYYWDPFYANGELDEELGKAILQALKNPKVPNEVKAKSLEIARSAAPANLFGEIIRMVKKGTQQDLAFEVLLQIWQHNADKNSEIANYNYFQLFKQAMPEAFTPPFKDKTYIYDYGRGQRPEVEPHYWLCRVYDTLAKVYAFDYATSKMILIKNDLYSSISCPIGRIFQDPRAYEDSNYEGYYDFESSLLVSMQKHLELEFKVAWLDHLQKKDYRLLRNAIYYSHGYKFKDQELADYFRNAKENKSVCRSGICGKTSKVYSDSLLTEIDKKNLAQLTKREQ